MLKRIKIQGFKTLKDVDVELKPLSVLFGPNAAGKSNFLDALQLLSRIVTSRTLKEAFEPPFRGKALESFTFGEEGIKGLINQNSATFCIEADIELSKRIIDDVNQTIRTFAAKDIESHAQKNHQSKSEVREKYLRYKIEIEIIPSSGILRVKDEYVAALNDKWEISRKRMAFLQKESEKNRLHLRMEGQGHPTYHELYLPYSLLSLPLYPPHYPHITALRKELERWLFFYFEPRERMRAPNPVKEVRHIGLMGEELAAFLNTLKNLDERQFHAIERALRLMVPSVTEIELNINNIGDVELNLLEGKTPISARLLSEGTLRILGLLALSGVKDPPALIGFEEPENGINPRRIRLIAEYLKTQSESGATQILATTHSPLLSDEIDYKSLYVCQKVHGQTKIVPLERWGMSPLAKTDEVRRELDSEELSTSERMIRGDFDA